MTLTVLAASRPPVGAIATGIARGALERLLEWLRSDPAADGLLDRQLVQLRLAAMAEDIQLARQAYMDAATELDVAALGGALGHPLMRALGQVPGSVRRRRRVREAMASTASREATVRVLRQATSDRAITRALGLSSMAKARGADVAMATTGAALEIVGLSEAPIGAELTRMIQGAREGELKRLVCAVPEPVAWTLPAYELALLAAARFEEDSLPAEVALVTAEPRPVDVLGEGPSRAVAELLSDRGIELHSAAPVRFEAGRLVLTRGEPIAADSVIALPEAAAPGVPGLPGDERGFLPVDDRCRAIGAERLYGAGDVTGSALKQGGIAAQQAGVAAGAIAADLGLGLEPEPLRPVLRALLLTGPAPRFRRLEIGRTRAVAREGDGGELPLAKVAGRRLAPFLAEQGVPPGAPPGMVGIELEAPAPGAPEPLPGSVTG